MANRETINMALALATVGGIALLALGIPVAVLLWRRRRKVNKQPATPPNNNNQSEDAEEKSNPIYGADDAVYSLANATNPPGTNNQAYEPGTYDHIERPTGSSQSKTPQYGNMGGASQSNQSDGPTYSNFGGLSQINQSGENTYSHLDGANGNDQPGAVYSTVGEEKVEIYNTLYTE